MILSPMEWLLLAVAAVLGWILYRLLHDGHVRVGTWEFPPRRFPGDGRAHRPSAWSAGQEAHGLGPGLPDDWSGAGSSGASGRTGWAMDRDRGGLGDDPARTGPGLDRDRAGSAADRDRMGEAVDGDRTGSAGEDRDRTVSAGRRDRPDVAEERDRPVSSEERDGPDVAVDRDRPDVAEERERTGRGGVLDDGLYTGLVNEMRRVAGALERQAEHVGALRVELRDRLRAIENRLEERARPASPSPFSPGTAGARGMETHAAAPSFGEPAPDPVHGTDGTAADGWLQGVETRSLQPLGTASPAMAVPAGGRPVEVREGVLVISHSLPPTAYAVPEGPGRARVFLNDQVEINEYALPKWAAFFEMRGARPYAMYRTLRAAEVSWDAQAERGVPGAPGIAEAV